MRYPGRRPGRKASPYLSSNHPRIRFLSNSEYGSSMGSMGSMGSVGIGTGAPGRDSYARPDVQWSELGNISEYEFENDDDMDSFVTLGERGIRIYRGLRGGADMYEGMRRGTPYDYGYRYAPGAFSPVQRPRAAPAGAPPHRERPAQKRHQKPSQQKMSHQSPGAHEIPTGAYATPATPTQAPPFNASSSTPAHATSEPPPPAAHGMSKASQLATDVGGRKAEVPVAPGGGEWIEGDPFLDACICSTNCMCRKGQRVLYRARAGDNTADGNGGRFGEIRYVFKDSVGRDCGDHSRCVSRDEIRRWREQKAKEKEKKAGRRTKAKRRRKKRKKKSKTKDNNGSVGSSSGKDDDHSESSTPSSNDDASSLDNELLQTLKKVQKQLNEMKLQGRNFGMCGRDQHIQHHQQQQRAGPYFSTTAAAPPPFHGAVNTNTNIPTMNPGISQGATNHRGQPTFQNGNPYVTNMGTNSNIHPGSSHQQHRRYRQDTNFSAFGQGGVPRGDNASPRQRRRPQRRHSRDSSDDILNDDDVEPIESYDRRFHTGGGTVRRGMRSRRDRYSCTATGRYERGYR